MGASCVKNRGGVPVAFSLQICIVFSLRQSSAYLTPASVRCLVVPKPGTRFHLCTATETQKKYVLKKKSHHHTVSRDHYLSRKPGHKFDSSAHASFHSISLCIMYMWANLCLIVLTSKIFFSKTEKRFLTAIVIKVNQCTKENPVTPVLCSFQISNLLCPYALNISN